MTNILDTIALFTALGGMFVFLYLIVYRLIPTLDRYRKKYGFDRTLEIGNTKQIDKLEKSFRKRLDKGEIK